MRAIGAAIEPAARQLADLQDDIGPAIRPLVRALSGIDTRLAGIRPIEITGDLPVEWQTYFSAGAGRSFESWAGAFDQGNAGYAVLYGPPALTGVLGEALGAIDGVESLGRVFAPRMLVPDAEGEARIEQEALLLRERDRPLYLRQLLMRADGFPVIEICPGDEPVGEGFLINHPNAVIISCEPNLLDDEGNLCLYWALAAEANPIGAANATLRELSSRGNSLRAREFIDAFVEKYTPRDHREWLSRTVLDRAWVHTRLGRRTAGTSSSACSGARLNDKNGEGHCPKAKPSRRWGFLARPPDRWSRR